MCTHATIRQRAHQRRDVDTVRAMYSHSQYLCCLTGASLSTCHNLQGVPAFTHQLISLDSHRPDTHSLSQVVRQLVMDIRIYLHCLHSLTIPLFYTDPLATVVSHNVPPYGRAGLYKELAAIKDFINDLRTAYFSSPLSTISSPSASSTSPSSLPLSSVVDLTPFKDLIPLITAAAEKSGELSTHACLTPYSITIQMHVTLKLKS